MPQHLMCRHSKKPWDLTVLLMKLLTKKYWELPSSSVRLSDAGLNNFYYLSLSLALSIYIKEERERVNIYIYIYTQCIASQLQQTWQFWFHMHVKQGLVNQYE